MSVLMNYKNLELEEFVDNATQGYISEKDFRK